MPRDNQLKITIIGGGSVAWTPRLVKDFFFTPAIANSQFVLYDIDKQAAELARTFLIKLAAKLGAKPVIIATDRRAAALDGAKYVLITISTGGLDAMAHDLAIPERFGIYHTVGDTCGPGGWARFIRNFDVFVALASDINRYAPQAVILNYTNPMATLTSVLTRLCGDRVIGLCHGLFENLALLQKLYKRKSEDDLAINYGGLNHFFWIDRARAGRLDVMADLRRRLKRQSFTDLLSQAHKDEMGFSSHREVATELFRQTGMMPYLGDRHTCEFFPCYITSRANLRKYRLVRTTIGDRRKMFRDNRRLVIDGIKGSVDEEFLGPSRETAADILNAHSQAKVFIDVGNVPNIGQIDNLPRGVVVETAVRVDATGFSPIAFGPLPDVVRGMVEPHAHVYAMLVEACFRRDRRMALQALRLDPVCSHLNGEKVESLGLALLKAHRRFIRAF